MSFFFNWETYVHNLSSAEEKRVTLSVYFLDQELISSDMLKIKTLFNNNMNEVGEVPVFLFKRNEVGEVTGLDFSDLTNLYHLCSVH